MQHNLVGLERIGSRVPFKRRLNADGNDRQRYPMRIRSMNIHNVQRIRAVIVGGKLMNRSALDRLLALAETMAKQN